MRREIAQVLEARYVEMEGSTFVLDLRAGGVALVKPGGLLVTSSCSRHVGRDGFVGMLQGAADDAHRRARIVAFGQQGADHPVHLDLPETAYLTCVFLEVA